jgi:hypothetical protein
MRDGLIVSDEAVRARRNASDEVASMPSEEDWAAMAETEMLS